MTIDELKTAFETQALATTGIETFAMDDLSYVNTNRTKTYPLFIMLYPQDGTNEQQSDYETWNLTCYIYDLENSKTPSQIVTRMSELKEISETMFRNLVTNYDDIIGINSRRYRLGHHEHGDKLIGVRIDLNVKIFNCRTSATD